MVSAASALGSGREAIVERCVLKGCADGADDACFLEVVVLLD